MKIDIRPTRSKRQRRRLPRPVLIGLVTTAVIVILLGVYFIMGGTVTARHARAAQAALEVAQTKLADQQFAEADDDLQTIVDELVATRGSLTRFDSLGFIPYVNHQLVAARHIIDGGIISVRALVDVADLADSIITPLTSTETISLASLSPDEKSEIIGKISDAEPELIDVQKQLQEARSEFLAVSSSGLVGPLKKVQQKIEDSLPAFNDLIDNALPLARVLPDLAGHPDQNTYLFLLENNSELRPTGGFIGTYGVIKVHEGEIIEFATDNVYNLDSKSGITVTPPLPLQRYVQADKWFLRDANWSPDFPTAAEQALWFYDREGGPTKGFDGVIAITPTVIARLLEVTGPIETDGVTFTTENFESQLYYQVSQGFASQGIAFTDRKDIIGNLGTILITKLLSLPQDQWPALWQNLFRNLKEKQFLLYSRNSEAQQLLVDQGWSGSVTPTTGDYVMVVDANMASLKSDPTVKRHVTYTLDKEKNTATLSMEYNHTGTFDIRTTRYRTYVRFYVPLGSEFISAEGNDKDIETSTELDKTVFGTFMSIEPGTTEKISITYTLAPTVSQAIEDGSYSLLAQKQAGTVDHQLTVELNFGRDVKAVTPHSAIVDKNSLRYQTSFLTDTTLDVSL